MYCNGKMKSLLTKYGRLQISAAVSRSLRLQKGGLMYCSGKRKPC